MPPLNLKAMVNCSHVWFKFSKVINGKIVNFRWEQLPSNRYEEFVDFKMKYYVRHEVTHMIAGIQKNSQAIEEYREIVKEVYRNPSIYTSICCVDDETSKIVGFDSMKMFRRGEVYKDFMEAKTAEVQKYYDIVQHFDRLCPVPNILNQYGVNQFFDDAGLAIHPEYSGFRLTSEVALLRYMVCKKSNVPLTGAWMTSPAVQQTTAKNGWETIYEISSKDLEKILGLKLPLVQMFMYKVKNIL